MYSIDSKLKEVELRLLRPTQISVGFREVEQKRESWNKLGAKERRVAMSHELFPVIKGPKKYFYIIDHHHTAGALIKEKSENVLVGVVKDLSRLHLDDFWIFMDHYSWVHPYDETGKRCGFDKIPTNFEDLKNDPYRSLAGEVRDAGGIAKSDAPFLEFLWANHFRSAVPRKLMDEEPKKALRFALVLARSKKSSYLPGWPGHV
ncbi:ParB-like protein [Variovorax sp. J22P271]|uniref:ParB-like protein n=1 Tax=Variovorax davisae TaxID=3053515 RepID=UPI002575BE76|nr:ParB-like protein [Variovorax sp. J22P271]MDM0032276.1 ParB-like protein [Variovorax sp. J22P271]